MDDQRLCDRAVTFARWQHSAMGGGTRYSVPEITCFFVIIVSRLLNTMGNSTSGRSWPRNVRDLFRNDSRTSRRHVGHNDRSSRHGATDVDDRPVSAVDTGQAGSTQRDGNGRTNYSKLNSCPDLQVAARSGYSDDQRRQRNDVDQPPIKLNVKIYRSYRLSSMVLVLEEFLTSKQFNVP